MQFAAAAVQRLLKWRISSRRSSHGQAPGSDVGQQVSGSQHDHLNLHLPVCSSMFSRMRCDDLNATGGPSEYHWALIPISGPLLNPAKLPGRSTQHLLRSTERIAVPPSLPTPRHIIPALTYLLCPQLGQLPASSAQHLLCRTKRIAVSPLLILSHILNHVLPAPTYRMRLHPTLRSCLSGARITCCAPSPSALLSPLPPPVIRAIHRPLYFLPSSQPAQLPGWGAQHLLCTITELLCSGLATAWAAGRRSVVISFLTLPATSGRLPVQQKVRFFQGRCDKMSGSVWVVHVRNGGGVLLVRRHP